jgi:hypothetical protein
MATHGYIKVLRKDYNQKEESTILHAFHDGYMDNMFRDIVNLPKWVYNYLKNEKSKSHYIYNMYVGDGGESYKKQYKDDVDRMIRGWDSMIPLSSVEYTFETFMIAQDPLMY